MNLAEIQEELRKEKLDGWLFFDHHQRDPLAYRVLHFAPAADADVDGPEPVHQMRVALRRLRSAVTVFRRMLDCPELQAANAGLKALSARLGPTREWDVFLGETAPAVWALTALVSKLHVPRSMRTMALSREFAGNAEQARPLSPVAVSSISGADIAA